MPRFAFLSPLRAALVGLALMGLPAAVFAQAGPVGAPQGALRAQVHRIPFDAAASVLLTTRICRPPGEARAPLLVLNHGSPGDPSARPRTAIPSCGAVARWFTQRGYVVAMPLRRGYGETGGTWAETYGSCNAADFAAGGLRSAEDIEAVVRYMRALPYVAPARLVVAGQSAGGWASLAYASRYPDGLVAALNFAGGRGGRNRDLPNNNCSPERLVAGAGAFGRTARVPTLWVYAENDTFFGPDLVRRMHAAFTAAGGRAQLAPQPAFGSDGHRLFGTEGMPIWTPIAGAFLDQVW